MKINKTISIASGIFILCLFVYIGIQNRRINNLQDENQLKAVELSTLKDTVAVYRTKAGELTYKLTSVEIERGNLKKSLELAGFDIKKLTEKDIAWQKVTTALRAQLAATGSVETTVTDTFRITDTDTVYLQRVNNWSNGYLSIFDGEITNKNLDFKYRYTTGIDIVQIQHKSASIVSVSLTDPNAAIVSGNSITIKHKKRFYEKGWIWAVIGFTGGMLIAK